MFHFGDVVCKKSSAFCFQCSFRIQTFWSRLTFNQIIHLCMCVSTWAFSLIISNLLFNNNGIHILSIFIFILLIPDKTCKFVLLFSICILVGADWKKAAYFLCFLFCLKLAQVNNTTCCVEIFWPSIFHLLCRIWLNTRCIIDFFTNFCCPTNVWLTLPFSFSLSSPPEYVKWTFCLLLIPCLTASSVCMCIPDLFANLALEALISSLSRNVCTILFNFGTGLDITALR